ncbi:glycosyl transferase, partial [Vibrio fortis]
MTFGFDPRRLDQDGVVETGMTYLKANVRRFFKGEMRNNEMNYQFGHYREQ